MTPRQKTTAYPQLEAFFAGYLHQDFPEMHGDLAGAVRAFAADAHAGERRALVRQWRTFRAEAGNAVTLSVLRATLGRRFGSAWSPRRRADLAELDRLIDALDPR